MTDHIFRTFHDLQYIGSFPVKSLDQDNRDDFIGITLRNSSVDSYSGIPITLIVAFEGIRTYYSDSKSLHMAHALRRISFATCDPEKFQFGFVAREPKQQWDQQLCHLFHTKTQQEAEQLNHVVGEVFRMVYSSQLQPPLNQPNQFDDNVPIDGKPNKYGLLSTSDNCIQVNQDREDQEAAPSIHLLNRIHDDTFNQLIDFQDSSHRNDNNGNCNDIVTTLPMKHLLPSSYSQTLKNLNSIKSDDDDEQCPLFNQKIDLDTSQDPTSSSFLNIVQNFNCKRMSSTDSNSSSSAATSSTMAAHSTTSSSSFTKVTLPLSSDKNNVVYPEELNNLKKAPWFQAGIPREISVDVLKREPIGSFIVRESTTKLGCYALSLRVPKSHNSLGIVHYLIIHTNKGYKIKGFTKEFTSITSLIIHHSVMQELLPCPLLLPRYYFLTVNCSAVQFNMFVLLASWLLRNCGIHLSIESNERKNQNLLFDHILKYLDNVDHKINFTISKLKEGAGKNVIEILDFLADRALEKCNFQWQKPKVINCGAINVEQMSMIHDHNSFDIDDNIGIELEQNSNVELKRGQDWYEEVERVSDRLKVELRADVDDWRYHYEEMKKYHKRMSNEFLTPIRNDAKNLIANLDQHLEKIENRDRHLNENFDHLLATYRVSNDKLLLLKEKHEKLQKQLKSRNLQLTEINDQIKDFREQLSLKDSSTINGSPILHIKKAINSLKSEIQEFDVRIDVLQVGLLQYRIGERKEVNSAEVCEHF